MSRWLERIGDGAFKRRGDKTSWEADLIFENLVSLRPKQIQILLEECSSIRVKRMFLFFAEKHNHQWLKKLDIKKIDLGSGDRLIHKKGRLDKKYRITIPKPLQRGSDDENSF